MGRKKIIRNYDVNGNLISMECGKCHEVKEVSEFYKDKNKKYGIRTTCKKCDNKQKAEYYKQNTDKIKKQQAEYYKQNANKRKEYQIEYQKKNYNKIKEYQIEYRKQNADKSKRYGKEYRKQNSYKLKEHDKERYNSKVEQALKKIKAYVEKDPERFNYNHDKEIYGIIYLVYNNKSQRYYVGQTTIGFDNRYKNGWIYGHNHKDIVKEDLEKYGEDSFEYKKIFKVAHNQEELDKLEAYYIEYFDSYENGYNETRGNIFTEREKK